MTREEILSQEILNIKMDLTQNSIAGEAIIASQQVIMELLKTVLEGTEAQAVYTAAMTDTLIGE